MKIRLGELRRLIREVSVSPSVKKNKTLDSALADHDVNDLVDRLDGAFEQALTLDLIVRNMDKHYNAETREFDDATYKAIKERVAQAKNKALAGVKKSVESAWSSAHGSESQGTAAPASGVRPGQKVAA